MREVRYVSLISWTLRSGSEHLVARQWQKRAVSLEKHNFVLVRDLLILKFSDYCIDKKNRIFTYLPFATVYIGLTFQKTQFFLLNALTKENNMPL